MISAEGWREMEHSFNGDYLIVYEVADAIPFMAKLVDSIWTDSGDGSPLDSDLILAFQPQYLNDIEKLAQKYVDGCAENEEPYDDADEYKRNCFGGL